MESPTISVRAGQTAQVRLDGFPWAQHGSVNARVQRVDGEVREVQGLQGREPRLPPQLLQHGLSGSVEVALESVSPAVLLLRAAGQKLAGPGATT